MLSEPSLTGVSEANRELNSQEYLAGKTRLASYPYHIQIGADNRCNVRCGFCLAEAYRERGLVHIQDRELERNPVELFERVTPYMKYWKYLIEAQNLRAAMKEHDPPSTCRDCCEFNRDNPSVMIQLDIEHEE